MIYYNISYSLTFLYEVWIQTFHTNNSFDFLNKLGVYYSKKFEIKGLVIKKIVYFSFS